MLSFIIELPCMLLQIRVAAAVQTRSRRVLLITSKTPVTITTGQPTQTGQSDPMICTPFSDAWRELGQTHGQSTLHIYTRPLEGFQYMLRQDHFICNTNFENQDDCSVMFEHLERGLVVESSPTIACLVNGLISTLNVSHPGIPPNCT